MEMKWTVRKTKLMMIKGMYEGDPYGDEIEGG
jgi:hypothetical protein